MTIKQAVDRVIGTTIDYALHPDQRRYQTHLEAERELLAMISRVTPVSVIRSQTG